MSLGCALALEISRALSTPHAKLASEVLLAVAKLSQLLERSSASLSSGQNVGQAIAGHGGSGLGLVHANADAVAARRVCVDALWRVARVWAIKGLCLPSSSWAAAWQASAAEKYISASVASGSASKFFIGDIPSAWCMPMAAAIQDDAASQLGQEPSSSSSTSSTLSSAINAVHVASSTLPPSWHSAVTACKSLLSAGVKNVDMDVETPSSTADAHFSTAATVRFVRAAQWWNELLATSASANASTTLSSLASSALFDAARASLAAGLVNGSRDEWIELVHTTAIGIDVASIVQLLGACRLPSSSSASQSSAVSSTLHCIATNSTDALCAWVASPQCTALLAMGDELATAAAAEALGALVCRLLTATWSETIVSLYRCVRAVRGTLVAPFVARTFARGLSLFCTVFNVSGHSQSTLTASATVADSRRVARLLLHAFQSDSDNTAALDLAAAHAVCDVVVVSLKAKHAQSLLFLHGGFFRVLAARILSVLPLRAAHVHTSMIGPKWIAVDRSLLMRAAALRAVGAALGAGGLDTAVNRAQRIPSSVAANAHSSASVATLSMLTVESVLRTILAMGETSSTGSAQTVAIPTALSINAAAVLVALARAAVFDARDADLMAALLGRELLGSTLAALPSSSSSLPASPSELPSLPPASSPTFARQLSTGDPGALGEQRELARAFWTALLGVQSAAPELAFLGAGGLHAQSFCAVAAAVRDVLRSAAAADDDVGSAVAGGGNASRAQMGAWLREFVQADLESNV